MKSETIGHQVNRRRLLQAAGLGGAAAFLPSLRRANAASTIPTRLLIFYSQHGFPFQWWQPTTASGGAPVSGANMSDLTLGAMHQALVPYKNDLIMLSGLDMRSWDVGPLQACGHINGQNHSLTNANQDGKSGGGPSIDQYVVQQLAKMNGGNSPTRIDSMLLGYDGAGNNSFFSAPATVVPLETSATKAYQRAFPNGTAPANAGVSLQAATNRRKSAMDLALGQFTAVENQLGKAEKDKLDAHASAVRDLENRLSLAPTTTCTAPAAPGAGTGGQTAAGWMYNTSVMPGLVAATFACDLTRVAAIMPGEVPDALASYTPGSFGTTDSHDLIHKVDRNNGPLIGNADALAVARTYHTAYGNIYGQILGALKAIPESDGQTLLDHTIVLWTGELAEGGHGCTNLRWMIGGSGGGYFKTGRYLQWGAYDRCQYCGDKTVPSNGDLFASVANAMGISSTGFGSPGDGLGPIAALRG